MDVDVLIATGLAVVGLVISILAWREARAARKIAAAAPYVDDQLATAKRMIQSLKTLGGDFDQLNSEIHESSPDRTRLEDLLSRMKTAIDITEETFADTTVREHQQALKGAIQSGSSTPMGSSP